MEANFSASSKQAESAVDAFASAIAELERVAGDFLTGPGRVRCLHAFEADPEALALLVKKTLTKAGGARNLLGLFVKIVDDEHREVSARLQERARAGVSAQPSADAPRPMLDLDRVQKWVAFQGIEYACDRHAFDGELAQRFGIASDSELGGHLFAEARRRAGLGEGEA